MRSSPSVLEIAMKSAVYCCRCLLAAAVVVLAAAAMSHAAAADAKKLSIIITVEAGKTDRVNTPVSLLLGKVSLPAGDLELRERGKDHTIESPNIKTVKWRGGKMIVLPNGGTGQVLIATPIPFRCQVDPGPPRRLCWVLPGRTPAGKTRTFVLTVAKIATIDAVSITKDEKVLEMSIGKAKVLRYNHAVVPVPKGVNPRYARGAYIHPLWSPDGQALTGSRPGDHYHHLGLWHPWTGSKFEGRKVNFWDLRRGLGTVRFAKFLATASGPVFGSFTALQEHVVLKAKGGTKVALNDTFSVTAWNLNGWFLGKVPDAFLVDFVSTQRCASDSPLELAKYRYGGFGFRGNPQWGYKNSNYLTSEGKKRKDGHATRARWCIIHGRAKEGPAGVIFMSHPANHAHPEPMRIWDERPEIFFNFCPIQKAPWTLKPGNDYVFRYRAYAFKGTVTAEDAERLWQDFANPPRATVATVVNPPPKIRVHTRHGVTPIAGATPTGAGTVQKGS